jgi:hypothetical protein
LNIEPGILSTFFWICDGGCEESWRADGCDRLYWKKLGIKLAEKFAEISLFFVLYFIWGVWVQIGVKE